MNKYNFTNVSRNFNHNKNHLLTNAFLSNILKYTLPHLIIEKEHNSHLIVDKINNRVHYAQLYYNLFLNENVIRDNNLFLMNKQCLLKKQFHKYDIHCYKVGTSFCSKLYIPRNIKSIHREKYESLIGVNEYLTNVGCNIHFTSNKDYKICFKNIDLDKIL
jgi:hypothetical protein